MKSTKTTYRVLASLVVLTLVFSFFSHISKAIEVSSENTYALCTDGIDNNGNFLVDASDPDCNAALAVENTLALCTDGIDNNGNFLVDLSDPSCNAFVPAPVENTYALCTDGIDNNGNFLVDASDPDCNTALAVENTLELCTDGIDNNGNFLVDASDPSCNAFTATSTPETATTTATTTETVTTQTQTASRSSGGGGSSRRISFSSVGDVLGTSTGEVLGASTCSPYITTYMKKGNKNNVEQVKKLQTFLNKFLKINLPVTGFFGSLTDEAVKTLQKNHTDEILKPWVDQGLATDVTPTGYVYKTTLWFINNQECADANTPVPNLK